MRLAAVGLVLLLAGCIGPGPQTAQRGDVVTVDLAIAHPDGPVLLSGTPKVVFDHATVLGELEDRLLGLRPGDPFHLERPARAEIPFGEVPGLWPLEYGSLPLRENMSVATFQERFGGPPRIGAVDATAGLPSPLEIPRRVAELGNRTGQEVAEYRDGRVAVSQTATVRVATWRDGVVTTSHGDAVREFDGTGMPRYEAVGEDLPRLVLPVHEQWVVVATEVEDGQRFPWGAVGGWMVADVGDDVDLRIEPVPGLLFPAHPEGATRTVRLDPLGLGVAGSYQVMAVEGDAMRLGHDPHPWAFLDGQDVVLQGTVLSIERGTKSSGTMPYGAPP